MPSIILYTKNQISDIVRFCCGGPSVISTVIGVDKTFNLSQLHVTVTAFKNLSVYEKVSGEHPVMFGPFFLHGNSDFDSFFLFFNHLHGVLNVAGARHQPIFGSDDEKSLRLALAKAFPTSKRVNCTRHLKKNVTSYLRDKLGINVKHRKSIVESIFGREGIVHAKNPVEFTCKLQLAKAKITSQMKLYFHKVFEKLDENFNASQVPHYTILKPDWTNNNCESLNHVLKQKVSWKSCDLPQLIMKLKEVVQAQYSSTEKALVGLSRWKLDSQ